MRGMALRATIEFEGAGLPMTSYNDSLISVVTKGSGYKVKEIPEYFWRDPTSVTGSITERKPFVPDIVEKRRDMFGDRGTFNN